jgi:hypothetical protein
MRANASAPASEDPTAVRLVPVRSPQQTAGPALVPAPANRLPAGQAATLVCASRAPSAVDVSAVVCTTPRPAARTTMGRMPRLMTNRCAPTTKATRFGRLPTARTIPARVRPTRPPQIGGRPTLRTHTTVPRLPSSSGDTPTTSTACSIPTLPEPASLCTRTNTRMRTRRRTLTDCTPRTRMPDSLRHRICAAPWLIPAAKNVVPEASRARVPTLAQTTVPALAPRTPALHPSRPAHPPRPPTPPRPSPPPPPQKAQHPPQRPQPAEKAAPASPAANSKCDASRPITATTRTT